ncbi:Laminin-like protein epi-1 [Wickerhamomyces ciferrii]|uniref:Laminin-like protein epi-1 n=1 Tax=Wickerhamomyces ciferrii (strain ATCC 14091 / BCRC 22168 / CBS 111 / JCM 3599 / NBRC 0793 / NRRL Y-1031 F-60-10) TaxID=1206466 RepID=K0KPK8_WICCF|nr:Laminin-like protein epi-1 [Wickerhamomyces ciferrii]CCH44926.1 Laminin-like protein epi-1 [Wickerhamomyces ciferrii]
MSDVLSKRELSEEFRDESLEADAKRQEDNNKKINKPGRKPLASEPKNKRTAQNRAAQRAFRERKERKLKDLEEKIDALEDEKKSANTESEFLRLQVQMLMNELAKHRGTHDISDLNLPKVPSPAGNGYAQQQLSSSNESNAPSSTFSDSGSTRTNSSNFDDFNNKPPQQPFSFEFPWSRKNSTTSAKSTQSINLHGLTPSNAQAPALASDCSTTSSAESSPFELFNNDDQRDLPLFNKVKATQEAKKQDQRTSNEGIQEFQFNEQFDEGISDFCKDLNSACGTKECPVPTRSSKSNQSSKVSTPLSNTNTPQTTNNDYEPTNNNNLNINEDPLSFLNDSNYDSSAFTFNNGPSFDPSMAFADDNNFDDLFQDDSNVMNSLTTEESIYDPFGIFNQAKSPVVERRLSIASNTNNKTPTTTNTTPMSTTLPRQSSKQVTSQDVGLEDIDENEVVPSRDGKLLKCTEIWDRITSHPKYSEIDIDGLCSELRVKAKCSDKGVVIDYADVNKVIDNSIQKQ